MSRFYSHAAGRGHATPTGHPEQVARFDAVMQGLEGQALTRLEAPLADAADLLRAHPQTYVERIRTGCPEAGIVQMDGDTFLSPGSWQAASRAVGGACAAVDAVVADGGRAFVAMRPPGHHATRETAMGFCLFATVGIAALRAVQVHGLRRVAVLDFDVHHGNGTQDILWNEAGVRFVSSHQMPLYPGSGYADERGAHGQITNLPLKEGSGGAEMWAAWAPVLDDLRLWKPELVLVSAGFDAHTDDPLGGLCWTTQDFAQLSRGIVDLAKTSCAGRVVSCLEGGYDLGALAASVAAHVSELGRPIDE
jgi:acetoin utilization deacetylase AcuC-like enzyme